MVNFQFGTLTNSFPKRGCFLPSSLPPFQEKAIHYWSPSSIYHKMIILEENMFFTVTNSFPKTGCLERLSQKDI